MGNKKRSTERPLWHAIAMIATAFGVAIAGLVAYVIHALEYIR